MGLGELSTVLVWGATTAYAVALVAFAIDFSRLAENRGAARTAARADQRVSAGAGSARSGVARDVPAAELVDQDAGATSTGDGVTAPTARRAVAIAMSTATLGLLLHTAGAVLRGIAAGRVPWANMYEFTLVGTLVAVAVFLGLCVRRDVRFLGTPVMVLVVPALGLGLAAFYVPADAVEPALQSYWLVIHVSIAIIATGLFAVGCAVSVLQLLRDSWQNASPRLAHPRWRLLGGLPDVRALEALSFRINAVGFVLWTFTVMAGAVWAEHAWGRYWGWDPKETWSFVVWVIYAAYLHARTTRGWSGRRAAWFVLVGFGSVLFNFTGVNLFFQGKHSYSGL